MLFPRANLSRQVFSPPLLDSEMFSKPAASLRRWFTISNPKFSPISISSAETVSFRPFLSILSPERDAQVATTAVDILENFCSRAVPVEIIIEFFEFFEFFFLFLLGISAFGSTFSFSRKLELDIFMKKSIFINYGNLYLQIGLSRAHLEVHVISEIWLVRLMVFSRLKRQLISFRETYSWLSFLLSLIGPLRSKDDSFWRGRHFVVDSFSFFDFWREVYPTEKKIS